MTTRTSLFTWLAITACILSIPAANAKTIHVHADATDANDGTSWADAYYYLQDALMFAAAGDIDGDCEVDFKDFAIMALHWLEYNQPG